MNGEAIRQNRTVRILICLGLIFASAAIWLVWLRPALTHTQNSLVAATMALVAAGFGATLPGVFRVSKTFPRGILRAGAAAALFGAVLFSYNYPAAETSHPVPTVQSPLQPDLHAEDKDGKKYMIVWQIDPACRGYVFDLAHHCNLEHTQTNFPGDNTPYDRWNISLEAPGPVYEVKCEPTGPHEFTEVKGYTKGTSDSNIARCSGWINGGDAPIRMTVLYLQRWDETIPRLVNGSAPIGTRYQNRYSKNNVECIGETVKVSATEWQERNAPGNPASCDVDTVIFRYTERESNDPKYFLLYDEGRDLFARIPNIAAGQTGPTDWRVVSSQTWNAGRSLTRVN
jgi:hypothetical protein